MRYVTRRIRRWHFIKCFPSRSQPSRTFYIRHNLIQVTSWGQNTEWQQRLSFPDIKLGVFLELYLKLIWETEGLFSDPSHGANLGGHSDKFRHRMFSCNKLDQANGPWKTCLGVPGNKWKPKCERNELVLSRLLHSTLSSSCNTQITHITKEILTLCSFFLCFCLLSLATFCCCAEYSARYPFNFSRRGRDSFTLYIHINLCVCLYLTPKGSLCSERRCNVSWHKKKLIPKD